MTTIKLLRSRNFGINFIFFCAKCITHHTGYIHVLFPLNINVCVYFPFCRNFRKSVSNLFRSSDSQKYGPTVDSSASGGRVHLRKDATHTTSRDSGVPSTDYNGSTISTVTDYSGSALSPSIGSNGSTHSLGSDSNGSMAKESNGSTKSALTKSNGTY